MDRITAGADENGVHRIYGFGAKGDLDKFTDGQGNSDMVMLTNRNGNSFERTGSRIVFHLS